MDESKSRSKGILRSPPKISFYSMKPDNTFKYHTAVETWLTFGRWKLATVNLVSYHVYFTKTYLPCGSDTCLSRTIGRALWKRWALPWPCRTTFCSMCWHRRESSHLEARFRPLMLYEQSFNSGSNTCVWVMTECRARTEKREGKGPRRGERQVGRSNLQ